MNAATGWCEGCARSIDEIAGWGSSDDATRLAVLARLPQRRQRLAELGVWAGPGLRGEPRKEERQE
jgi:predicted Fe-S protein YdhL (DUF1289 family)